MPFVKGKSGNPGGKPGDKPLTEALRRKLYADERKKLDQLADIMFARAMSGDMQAIKEIADRLEGKPVQQVESHNVNENHYVRAPEKASKDDWQQYLAHKAKPPPVSEKPNGKSNGSSNGKSH